MADNEPPAGVKSPQLVPGAVATDGPSTPSAASRGGEPSRAVADSKLLAEELILAHLNRAALMCERGPARREDVDAAMRLGCGLPAGPFEMLDQIGLDVALGALTELCRRTGDEVFRPAPSLRRLVDEGRLGCGVGAGFYPYPSAGPGHGEAAGHHDTRTDDRRVGAGGSGARALRRIGVLGSGTMARGIAEATAVAGLSTTLVARREDRAGQALDGVGGSLAKAVVRGKISAGARDRAMGLLDGTDQISALAGCDLVIEAVVEDLPVKLALFAELDRVCRPGAVLATTTSSLSVAACAEATTRPADVLGLHFFNPAPVMRLVEVVGTRWTADDVFATARGLCDRLGKTGVVCADTTGFIVNYLLFPYLNDAVRMLDHQDVDVEELDDAVRAGYGFPMGPFTLLDAVGLDVSLAIQRRLYEEYGDARLAPAASLERMVAAGRLGRKTGGGFRVTSTR